MRLSYLDTRISSACLYTAFPTIPFSMTPTFSELSMCAEDTQNLTMQDRGTASSYPAAELHIAYEAQSTYSESPKGIQWAILLKKEKKKEKRKERKGKERKEEKRNKTPLKKKKVAAIEENTQRPSCPKHE